MILANPKTHPGRAADSNSFLLFGSDRAAGGLRSHPAPGSPNWLPSLSGEGLGRFRSRTGLKPCDHTRPAEFLFHAPEARHDRVKAIMRAEVQLPPHVAHEDAISAINAGGVLKLRGAVAEHVFIVTMVKDRLLFGITSGTVHWDKKGNRLVFILELDLNPTRWLEHQGSICNGFQNSVQALTLDPEKSRRLSALTLDKGDNVLTSTARLGSTVFDHRGSWWRGVLTAYIGHIKAFLEQILVPTACGARLVKLEDQTVRQAEVHWELEHPRAVAWANDFCKAVRAANLSARVFERPIEEAGIANCRWVKIRRTQEVIVKVYAKQQDRVRLEIEFHDRINQTVKRAGGSTETLVDTLMGLQDPAAQHLQALWTNIMTFIDHSPTATVSLCDFVEKLTRAVPEAHRPVLIDLLISHRHLAETSPDSFAPPRMCQDLVREGLLVRVKTRNRGPVQYALALPYSRMFDRMLGQNDAPPSVMNA
jgi:hypothetical protein